MKVSLIVVQGKPEGKVIPLSMPLFKIGRGEGCHLRPNNEQVSRNHAEILISEESVVLRDLGSRNGTFVNNKRLSNEEQALKNKDLIQVGPLTFAVSIQGAPVSASASKLDPVARATSLDDVSNDQIDSWLVGDQNHPAPERPSGVYTGDTMTFNAFKDASKPKSNPATPQPAAKAPEPVAPKAPEPEPEPVPQPVFEEQDTVYDKLDDEDEPLDDLGDDTEVEGGSDASDEGFVDESNPFYAAKKAQAEGESEESKSAGGKQSFKDSSAAAEDLLRKMMERRRATR